MVSLPVLARLTADSALTSIQYRVVETKIGDQVILSPDANGDYGTYHPYQPDQVDSGNAQDGFTSAITNRLETTKITASKSWTSDNNDAWGTRPGDGTTWSVTYLLQRKLDAEPDDAWKYLTGYGDGEATDPADPDVISQTITGTTDSSSATWENLPECDVNGNAYEYRIVEQVPGSYDVTGGIPVDTAEVNGVTYRYYVVSGSNLEGAQAYVNALRTVDLTGTKQWNDYGTGLANSITEADLPTMVLYRQIEGGTAEQVKMKNGTDSVQPVWSKSGNSNTWTFVYRDLPAADKNDKPYTYWAVEQAGTSEGYYPIYGTSGAGGTTTEGDQQTVPPLQM